MVSPFKCSSILVPFMDIGLTFRIYAWQTHDHKLCNQTVVKSKIEYASGLYMYIHITTCVCTGIHIHLRVAKYCNLSTYSLFGIIAHAHVTSLICPSHLVQASGLVCVHKACTLLLRNPWHYMYMYM